VTTEGAFQGHPPESREEALALVLARLVDRLQGGEEINLDSACREHPEFCAELSELWGTTMVTQAIGQQRRDLDSVSGPRRPVSETVPLFDLPAAFGDYELLEELGRGGMGVVYRAVPGNSGDEVALKMMLQDRHVSPGNLARFRAEARAVQGLEHPNIIRITDIGDCDGRAYFCMELIEGETLADRLARGPMPPRQTARILLHVARAIAFAHENGVLHRDIKPSNILLRDEDNKPFVCDFGLAREIDAVESLTRTGAILGTPAYMAPEQAAGRRGEVGPVSDVYSLGALLYHMLTGRPPFQAASPVDTVLLLLEQEPMLPRVLNREVDRQLEMIAMRCLQKPQDLRYQSATELAADLQSCLNNEPVSAERGRFGHVIANLMKETHHANILENWGLLWMWHSLALLIACWGTEAMYLAGVQNRWWYWLVWTAGFGAWAMVFWYMRRRMGPVTFVERQIAHIWLGSIISVAAMFPFEWYLGLPVLSLAPLLALVAGMVFLVKASILAGGFYLQAIALFATALLMAVMPRWSLGIFGVVSGACFFFPGLKYHRKSERQERLSDPGRLSDRGI
jgi:serine/threonine-protein kinase